MHHSSGRYCRTHRTCQLRAMTTRTQRDALRAQLIDTRRMKDLAGEHPLMSLAIGEREDELERYIEALPLGCDYRCTMDPIRAGEAYERVAATVTDTQEIQLPGVFKGMLLESWRFDFVTRDGHKISGKIEDDLAPERAAELNRQFFNLPALATLDKTTVLFKNGRERTTHTLKNLTVV